MLSLLLKIITLCRCRITLPYNLLWASLWVPVPVTLRPNIFFIHFNRFADSLSNFKGDGFIVNDKRNGCSRFFQLPRYCRLINANGFQSIIDLVGCHAGGNFVRSCSHFFYTPCEFNKFNFMVKFFTPIKCLCQAFFRFRSIFFKKIDIKIVKLLILKKINTISQCFAVHFAVQRLTAKYVYR